MARVEYFLQEKTTEVDYLENLHREKENEVLKMHHEVVCPSKRSLLTKSLDKITLRGDAAQMRHSRSRKQAVGCHAEEKTQSKKRISRHFERSPRDA